ncbi:MAG: cadmium-translocating P-type ATPase [Clostridia bacterium]|nr:cadmium-translocating P-type ATPase [Clostridia bacterium]
MKRILKLENLHCAACAMDLEDLLKKISGVSFVAVNFLSQSVEIDTETDSAFSKAVKAVQKFEKVRIINLEELGFHQERKASAFSFEVLRLLLSGVLFATAWVLDLVVSGKTSERICVALYIIAYLTVGLPVLVATVKSVVKGKIFDENFLMTVASIGAVLLGLFKADGHGGLEEGVAVMFLYQLGEYLQSIAVQSSRKSLKELMKLKSETAVKITGEKTEEIKPEQLAVGDRCLVKAGERVPADGILLSERAEIDVKSLTGEPLPRSFVKGDELLSGYVCQGEAFQMQVTKKADESAAAKILELVENASSKKAAPEKFITKFAKIYTPIVCLSAFALAFCMPLFVGVIRGVSYGDTFARWVKTALNLLIISCPCALVISVPLTYFGGIGACAKVGVLVKGAVYLDEAAQVKKVALDKTGTLTKGDFSVVAVYPENGVEKEKILSLATAVEQGSSHPIAKAFERYSDCLLQLPERIFEQAGFGVKGMISGKEILVGKAEFLRNGGVSVRERESENTLLYLSENGEFLGCIEIGDELKTNAKESVGALKDLGLNPVILTGDHTVRAQKTSERLGDIPVIAELLPEEKLRAATEFAGGEKWLYVGDGINDAPVMAASDCSVSMGKLGSAAAVETSDFVLISDDLSALPKAIKIARKTRKTVKQNVAISVIAKVILMTLGIWGVLPLWAAVFGDVGVMLVAVCNSFKVRL